MKRAVVSVINDLATDQRVHKICLSLQNYGYEVLLVGRKWRNSLPIKRNYAVKRFSLPFNKGAVFYACYNIRLLFFLLFKKIDLLWSNDLDTLPVNYLISKIKSKPIIYDSHEYFTEVPELIDRKKVRKIWLSIEKKIFPHLENVFTVSPSIAQAYTKKYNVPVNTLFNFPQKQNDKINYNANGNIIIYQGSINKNRGVEELISAMQYIDEAELWIVGTGDEFEQCKALVKRLNLGKKIDFKGKIPLEELFDITRKATIGVSLEKNTGLNYTFALPNKLFDYCAAGIPVLASDLPEMAGFVRENKVGLVLKEHSSEGIAEAIKEMRSDKEQLQQWHKNALRAIEKNNWQIEEKKLYKILKRIES